VFGQEGAQCGLRDNGQDENECRSHLVPPEQRDHSDDLRRDQAVLDEARRAAEKLFGADPGLALPDHARLRRQMLTRYGNALELSDVG